ncbi:MAG TPA: DUF3488 and transglutaminase-like domain-containing protein, partial [Vulgatibacter sp.]
GGGVPPAPGPAQLLRLGDALAGLQPAPAAAPGPRIHRGAQGFVVEPAPATAPAQTRIDPGREPKGTRATGLTLARAQRSSLLAASLIGFSSLAISGELAGWAMAIFVGAAAVNLALREGVARVFRNGANVLALGALAVLVLQVFLGQTGIIVAAPTFAVVLAASRLLGRRGPADDALLLLAALLMLAGGAALTGELAYGLCFAAFAVAGTVSLCLTHLRREAEGIADPPDASRDSRVSAGLISALGGLSLAVLVGSALVFVLFPRVSAGMLNRAGQVRTAGGAAERIDLGGVGVIKDDPTPVMRVRFPEARPAGDPYWRTATFRHWTGRGWSRGEEPRHPVAGVNGVWKLAPARDDAVVADVEWLGRETAIPLPGAPIELRIPARRRVAAPILLAGGDGVLEFAGSVEPRFTVTSSPGAAGDPGVGERRRGTRGGGGDGPGEGRRAEGGSGGIDGRAGDGPDERGAEGGWRSRRGRGGGDVRDGRPVADRDAPSFLEAYLEVPDDLDPRIRALAGEFSGIEDPRAIAEAIVARLGRDLRYTRELPGPTADPLAHFLFERREGHCEYFASSLVMLLRLAGVPARVAAGYFGAHWVEAGGYFVVREGDAHAWTEAWIPGEGWTRFDATPPDDRAGTAEGLVAGVVGLLDLVRYWWAGWVLDFDRSAQAELAASVAEAFAGREGAGKGLSRAVRIGIQLVLLALAVALAVRTSRRWRALRGARLPRGQQEAAALYRSIKRDLRRRGATLPPGATGADWAAAAVRVAPANAPAIRAAIDAYEAARFGSRAIPKAKLRALRRAALGR